MANLTSKGLPRSIPDVYERLEALESGSGISIAPVTTPDGSDAGTTQTLANALKAKVNEIIAAING